MSKSDVIDRIMALQGKANLTAAEDTELEYLTAIVEDDVPMATESQIDYIEHLLGKLNAELEDYTHHPMEHLTLDEASDLIDELKDDVTEADAWED